MAEKIVFTNESLKTFVDEIQTYTNNATSIHNNDIDAHSNMGWLSSEDEVADSPTPFDADTLNGHDAEYFDNQIAVERARINQFVALEDGSTTGDAELQDLRIGANGITYESAGDAVRDNINATIDSINKINSKMYPSVTWTLGGITINDGNNTENSVRMRTDYLDANYFIEINISDTHQLICCAYDSNKQYLGYSGDWATNIIVNEIIGLYPDTKYIRLIMSRIKTGAMDDNDIKNSNVSFNMLSRIDGLSSAVNELNKIYNENENKIDELIGKTELVPTKLEWEIGGILSKDGSFYGTTIRARNKKAIVYNKNLQINISADYKFYLHFYGSNNEYLGNTGAWLTSNVALKEYDNFQASTFYILVASITNDIALAPYLQDITDNVIIHNSELLPSNLLNLYQPPSFDYTQVKLPILYLTGDVSAMTKDNTVTLDYRYKELSGTCTCKWQGSSSVRRGYPKRNYTIKFDNAFEASDGWGEQKKYCLKANWIDPSGARNVVNAKLWGQIVKSRVDAGEITDNRATSPNYGAVDGFPCIILINNEFIGLYTWNIPKDSWMFNMGNGESEYVVCSESNYALASLFKAESTFVGDADKSTLDYSIEVKPDDVDDSVVINSFNTLLRAAIDAGNDWESVLAPYLDIDSVFDYFIFVNCIAGIDNLGKNILYGTYDGTKWFMSAYDLDATFGSNVYGESWHTVVNVRNQFKDAADMHKLAYLIYTYSRDKLKARYKKLRSNILSNANVWYTLTNFVNTIPLTIYNKDAEKWPTMNSTSMANVHTYMEYYRMHCDYLDKEIENM